MNKLQQSIKALTPIWWGRGGSAASNIIREPHAGAWQQNRELAKEDALSFHAVYACMALISSSIAKLPVKLVAKGNDGIWRETTSPSFSPVLAKPNRVQTRIQFWESYLLSLLGTGSTYVLLRRDRRNVVVEMYVLDGSRVKTLVSESGDIFYELQRDPLNTVGETITVPASEILADRMNPLYHPLVGIPPIYAASLPVLQAREIQNSSVDFFKNHSRVGGILTAPGAISDETAQQLREHWKASYAGANAGKIAVLADGLSFQNFQSIDAQSSQVIETLQWSAQVVCSVFQVPPFMVNVGELPSYDNVENLTQIFYSQALQNRIEAIEILLDEALNLPTGLGVEFHIDSLVRMNTKAIVEAEVMAVAGSIKSPNEARLRLGLGPVAGGESPLSQMQYYSLESLSRRDSGPNPFGNDNDKATPAELEKLIEIHRNLEVLKNAA